MTRYLTSRLLGLLAVLLVTSLIVFGTVHLAPGDPVTFLLHGRPATPDAVAALRTQYHLDDPLPVQYAKWLGDVLQGDFGRSTQFHQDVGSLIVSRLPGTALLVGYAALLVAVLGVAAGIMAALRPGAVDRAVLLGTGVATATPRSSAPSRSSRSSPSNWAGFPGPVALPRASAIAFTI